MKLFYLLEGMVAYVRGAVRRGRRWLRRETVIPDTLRVLPEASRYTISVDGAQTGSWAVHDQETGLIWGPFRYGERPVDPVKRAYDIVAETNRVLTEVFGGPWDLPPDPFDPEDWEGLLLADYDDVIVRGDE